MVEMLRLVSPGRVGGVTLLNTQKG